MEDSRIQHFERILRDNPQSRAFAPLTEAYRKNGQLEEALKVALKGVQINQGYHGGRVALARVLVDLNQLNKAKHHLERVMKEDTGNILALRVLGKVYIQLKEHEQAIEVYTQIKSLHPEDQKSEKILEGLRKNGKTLSPHSVVTQEHSQKPSHQHSHQDSHRDSHQRSHQHSYRDSHQRSHQHSYRDSHQHSHQHSPNNAHVDLEKKMAFIDALLNQSKYKKAEAEIHLALQIYQEHPDLKKRLHYITGLFKQDKHIPKSSAMTPYTMSMEKIKTLKLTLKNIEERQKNDPNF